MGSTKPTGPRPHHPSIAGSALTIINEVVNIYGEDEHFSAVETVGDFFSQVEGVTKAQAESAFDVIDGLIDSNSEAMSTEKNIYNDAMDVVWVEIAHL